mgnify:CR=1 FL=1
MKKTLLLAVALACSGTVAQEKQIWACQMVEGTMIKWESDRWINYLVIPYGILFTLRPDNIAIAKRGDSDTSLYLNCSHNSTFNRYSCLNSTLGDHYLLSPDDGKLGYSQLTGAISTAVSRDSINAETFNCTKF